VRSGPLPERASFLGRLAHAGREGGGEVPIASTPGALGPLVARNLRFLLNTKKTHGSVLVDYGLGDYDDPRRIQGDIDVVAREIQATVAVYEPRIVGPTVKAVAHDAARRIDYELSGAVAGEPMTFHLVFVTRSRGVTVEEP
jgi:type VI secretion system lysozyme-like protein